MEAVEYTLSGSINGYEGGDGERICFLPCSYK